jgi:hypothetical protein
MLYSIIYNNKQNELASVEAPTSSSNQCPHERASILQSKCSSLRVKNQYRRYHNEHATN